MPQFQIETSICQESNKQFVTKKALTSEAVRHVRDIAHSYEMISEMLIEDRLKLPSGFQYDESRVIVDYMEGVSYDSLLFDALLKRDDDRFRKLVDDYMTLLETSLPKVSSPVLTDQLKQVFGLSSAEELEGFGSCFAVTLIDPLFENILVDKEKCYLIDNEWVFEGCVPISFVLFRSLFYFFQVKYADFGVDSLVSLEIELKRYGVSRQHLDRYYQMEECFQAYVFGEDRPFNYKPRYAQRRKSVADLEQTIEYQSEMIRDLHDQVIARDSTIADIMQSKGWRFVQSVTRLFNHLFPPGKMRRRFVMRVFRLGGGK